MATYTVYAAFQMEWNESIKTLLKFNGRVALAMEISMFLLFLIKNIDYEYSLEPPQRDGGNVYPQSMFKVKKLSTFSQ